MGECFKARPHHKSKMERNCRLADAAFLMERHVGKKRLPCIEPLRLRLGVQAQRQRLAQILSSTSRHAQSHRPHRVFYVPMGTLDAAIVKRIHRLLDELMDPVHWVVGLLKRCCHWRLHEHKCMCIARNNVTYWSADLVFLCRN